MGSDKRSTTSLEHLYLFYNCLFFTTGQSCLFYIIRYQSHVVMKYIIILVVLCGIFNPPYFNAAAGSRKVPSLCKN